MPDFLDSDGIWAQVLGPAAVAAGPPRPALFLDRDGVIVEEVGFLHRPEDVRLIPGAAAAIAAANRTGVPVVVLTNQSGIGRGLYGWAAFAATQDRIVAELAGAGAALDMVLACPFHPDGAPPYRHPDHPCRKPRPGMLVRAGERLGLDLAASWIVGDRAADLEAGRAAGLAGGLHVLTGHGAAERPSVRALRVDRFEVRLGESIAAALEDLLPRLRPAAPPRAGETR
ncbi:MAG: D-glycero-alpha-D-manno-heptose-1,7-bisphosphate 7-phosphatase [Kiloniellaceae bacterium]